MNKYEKRQLSPSQQSRLDNYRRTGNGIVEGQLAMDGQSWVREYEIYKDGLVKVSKKCPHVSFSIPQSSPRTTEVETTDIWGCVWKHNTTCDLGQVVKSPLEDLSSLKDYSFPNPAVYMDWDALDEDLAQARLRGEITGIPIPHNFFYLKLVDLCGYQNCLIKFAELSKDFERLIELMTEFWVNVAHRMSDLKPDIIIFGDDFGMQNSLPMSPKIWSRTSGAAYRRIFSACKKNGALVYLHSCGYVVDLIPLLIDCGVDVLNVQDMVNGIDNLQRFAKNNLTIALDIDRQQLLSYGSPYEIDMHIAECVKRLGSPSGGLFLKCDILGGVPIENIEATFLAMEKYHDFHLSK